MRDDVLPVLYDGVRSAVKAVAAIDAGIVHQDRDVADFARDLRRHDAAGIAVGHVEREGLRLAAGVEDLLRGLRGGIRVDIEHHDARAFARIAGRDGASDAGARAGYGRDVILQEPRHVFRSSLNERAG
jgi:hypothetical protein